MDYETANNTLMGLKNFNNWDDVHIPEGVTRLKMSALGSDGCDFKTVFIPKTVEFINEDAFKFDKYANHIKSFEADKDNPCFSSENGALYDKDKKTLLCVPHYLEGKFVVNDNTVTVMPNAFYLCSKLTDIEFGNKVQNVHLLDFTGCSSLENVTFPSGYNSENCPIFKDCQNLKNIELPDSIKYLTERNFMNCEKLENVKLSKSLVNIGWETFSNCKSLKSITLPESLEEIGNDAFTGCHNLTSFNIPANLTKIDFAEGFLNDCPKLNYIDTHKENTMFSSFNGLLYNKTGNKLLRVPEDYKKEITFSPDTEYINTYAFRECNNIKSITIPDSVLKIGFGAFYNCENLTNVTLPRNLDTVNKDLFYGCKKLTDVTIPHGIKFIGETTFYGCESLESLNIPEDIDAIYSSAFAECKKLENINIPDGIPVIESNLFENCKSLKTITVPSTVRQIGSSAFSGCSSLETFNVRPSKKEANKETAPNYNNFKQFSSLLKGLYENIENSFEKNNIASQAFAGCNNLKEITVPEKIDVIEDDAFSSFENLTIYGKHNSCGKDFSDKKGATFIEK